MVNEQTRGATISRSLKRPLILFLIAVALMATLAVAERQGATPIDGTDIARRSGTSRLSQVFGNAASRAQAVQVPSRGGAAAAATTPDAALSTAQNTAGNAVQQANQAAGAAVAAQEFPPFVSAIVCPILFRARATVVAVIGALIQQFPQLAPQLNAVLASALATIDAQLFRFGCIPSI